MTHNNRPLSPHLSIYKPQLTSVLSILHRLTGVGLSFGAIGFVFWLLALAHGPTYFDIFMAALTHWFGQLLLFGVTFSFFYHLANGVRHLVWDAGYGYDLPMVYQTGWIVVAGSIVMTLLTWVMV